MAKVIDLSASDGDLVILGRSLVLPNSTTDSQPNPLNGALRFNPQIGQAEIFFAGVWTVVGGGTGTGTGDGSSNNHTHTISQIIGLQSILNNKSSIGHTHTINDVAGLATALSSKADSGHTHTISAIAGLQTALDGKAPVVHNHTINLSDSISGCLPASPPANYKIAYTAATQLTFPVNFAGSIVKAATNPAMIYAITLLKNGTSVGSITLYPSGQVVFSLASAMTLLPGDTLVFQCPARDTAINTISFSLLGSRAPQTTA